MKIGVFDSGLGGLTILKEILKKAPQYDYIYLGDNARVPYGGRSPEILYQFTKEAVDFLFANNCQIVLLACNSATANALKKLQTDYLPEKYPGRKVLGIIKPTIEFLLEHQQKKVAIIGTHATVDSGAYIREIKKVIPNATIWQQACPLLVPLIEENEVGWEGTELLLQKYLQPLIVKQPAVLLLACTHYGLLQKRIAQVMGQATMVIGQGQLVATKLLLYLEKHLEIKRKLSHGHSITYYVTDLNPRFQQIANRFLGREIKIVRINLQGAASSSKEKDTSLNR